MKDKQEELPLLKCPNCGSHSLRINLVNRFKRRHYFVVWCVGCDFAQKFNPSNCFGFEFNKEDPWLDGWKTYNYRNSTYEIKKEVGKEQS